MVYDLKNKNHFTEIKKKLVKLKPLIIISYCTKHKKNTKNVIYKLFNVQTNRTEVKGAKSATLRPRIRESNGGQDTDNGKESLGIHGAIRSG